MNKFQRSWLLLKSSLQVIFQNKTLLVFPIVIFTLTLVIVLFFLAPVALRPTGYNIASAEHWKAIGNSIVTQSETVSGHHRGPQNFSFTPGAAAYLAFMYFVSMFFATFFNVAFYHEILNALGGQPVSIRRGLRFACTRWRAVLMWTLFAGLVGLIIRTIEERLAVVGRIIAGLIGLAWSVASMFVIPIIVCDEKTANPLKLLRESAGTLKKTWGETLIGYVGLSFANTVGGIALLVFLAGGIAAAAALQSIFIFIAVAAVSVLVFSAWAYLVSVGSQVYKCALFVYATEGVVPASYTQETLNMAWKHKKT